MKLIMILLLALIFIPNNSHADASTRVPNCYDAGIAGERRGTYIIGYKDVAQGTLNQLLAYLNSRSLEVVYHLKNVRAVIVRAKNRTFTRHGQTFQRQVERQLLDVAEKPFVYSIECNISQRW